MCHWTGILGKLCGAQKTDIFDTLDRTRAHIGRKFCIPKHREAFLQAQLEPVPTGYPVTGPVMEILMRNHRFHSLESKIGGGVRIGKYTGGIEDVQTLVFHGPHIEIIHCHNHEDVQIIFAAVNLLIPAHGVFQRQHGMVTFIQILFFHKNLQPDITTRTGGKAVLYVFQITGHQRKQIAGFTKRIFPGNPVTPVIVLTALNIIAVG